MIKTRKPTGSVPYPLVLLEGGEKVGKSWAAAELTASDRVGQCYWLDLGEGAADEYAAIPGADYLIVDHDGTWRDILHQISEIHAEAAKPHTKPVVLIIDSMTAEWDLLKGQAQERARCSRNGQRILAKDPDADVKPTMNLWNDANDRHNQLMRLLMTFPGIVVMTARGKEVAALDGDGKPVSGEKDYRVEAHKAIAFDASVHVRLSRDQPPMVVGARSVFHGLRPGVDKPRPVPDFSIEWLVFDVLKCDPHRSHVRDLTELSRSDADPVAQARADLARFCATHELDLHAVADRFAKANGHAIAETTSVEAIRELMDMLADEINAPEPEPEPEPEPVPKPQPERTRPQAVPEPEHEPTSADPQTIADHIMHQVGQAATRDACAQLWRDARAKLPTDLFEIVKPVISARVTELKAAA